MRITALEVSGFRNIENLVLCPGERLNVFYGSNGQGKTNLLEAIFACVRAKSFRPYAQKKDWVPIHLETSNPLRVHLSLENAQGYSVDCKLTRDSAGKWEFYYNEKKVSPAKMREQIPVVAFSPDDHSIIRGTPELRRDYLDEVFTDICPGYAEVLDRFERSLKSRNRLLKTPRKESVYRAELSSWTAILAQSASDLSELRCEVWPGFEFRFGKLGAKLFQEFGIQPHIAYQADYSWDQDLSPAAYLKHIENDLEKDFATGWTHRGPQRDDFSISLDGIEARTSASQGQARLAALLLKWLHADWVMDERGEIPLFLIDDLSSELDAERRSRLLTLTQSIKGQIFVTTTEPSFVDSGGFSEYTKVSVKKGVFEHQAP